MGFISDAFNNSIGNIGTSLGFGGGNTGANYTASTAPIIQPVTADQSAAAQQQALGGIDQQQAFINALASQGGIGNQSSVFNQMQGTANQLQGIANGQGPNPALAQLANATGQNTANQAALMASQRGANANAGLLARQAAQVGAQNQQTSAGQAATLQAQQSLGALSQLQSQQSELANLAGTQVGQQANALTGYNQASQSNQASLLGAVNNYNQSLVGTTSNTNNTNENLQAQNAGSLAKIAGGFAQGAGSAAVKGAAHGGMITSSGDLVTPAYAKGGRVKGPMPRSFVGQYMNGMHQAPLNVQTGGLVPGRAPVKGDSYKNDTVPAMVSSGEVVIPRHVMESKDPVKMGAAFIAAIVAKQKGKKGEARA